MTLRATASQVTITAQAAAQGFKPAAVQLTGQVTRNGAPVLNPGGTLNAFVPVVGSPLAPGMIVQIYGSNLASQVLVGSTIPLTTALNNTSVIIGGIEAPLYFVSPGQINAQVLFELKLGRSRHQVIVNANGALSTPNPIQLCGGRAGHRGVRERRNHRVSIAAGRQPGDRGVASGARGVRRVLRIGDGANRD